MQQDPHDARQDGFAPALLWAAAYVVIGVLVALAQPLPGQSPWYPPTAIGIAMLLLCGRRWWPLVLGCELIVSFVQYRTAGPAVASATVTTLEVVTVTSLLRWWRFDTSFRRAEDVMRLAVSAGTVTLVGAAVGVVLVRATGFVTGTWPEMARVWFVGDITGITAFLPVLLLVVAHPTRLRRVLGGLPRAAALELAGVSALAIGLQGWITFTMSAAALDVSQVGATFVSLLPLLWVAVRFGRRRTSVVALATNAVALIGVTAGHQGQVTSLADYAAVEFFMLVASLASLGVAVTVDAERRATRTQESILDASPVAIVGLDLFRRVRVWNPAAERMFGWRAAEVIGQDAPMIAPAEKAGFAARTSLNRPIDRDMTYVHRDGHPIESRLHGAPLFDEAGDVAGRMGLIEDVTERRAVERERDLLTTAIDQAAEAVLVTDPSPAIVYANPAAVTISGYSLEELLGQNPRIVQSGEHDLAFYQAMWADLVAGRSWSGTLVNRHKDGSRYEQEAAISPVFGETGQLQAYVAVLRDLTRERALEADLSTEQRERRDLAATLGALVTGPRPEDTALDLCTAALGIDDVEGSILLRRRPDGRLTALAGLLPGDVPMPTSALNREASDLILTLSAAGPWTADWRHPPSELGPVTETLERNGLTAIGGVPVRWHGATVAVLIGGTTHPDGVERLQHHEAALAEIAAHAAALLGPELAALDDRDVGQAAIGEIIEHARFHPVFQPVVSLETGAVVGYEALTRFDDGTRPDLVFGQADAVGRGPDLERACLRAALDASRALPATTWLALNVSPDLVLADEVAPLLVGHDRRIVLEVTEHVEIADYDSLRHALERIDGAWVSVDDAGAGYASLRHILELRPDIVKLDIALVRGIDADPARQAMVAGMRHFAAETLTHLLAEGVETQAEADTVRRLGVEYVQGYPFGRPEPIAALTS